MFHLFVFEVDRSHDWGKTIAGIPNGGEETVMFVMIHSPQEDFIDVVQKTKFCLDRDVLMELCDYEVVFVFRSLKTRTRVYEGVFRIDSAFLPACVEKEVRSSGEVVSVGVMAAERTAYRVVERWIGASMFLEEAEFVCPCIL